MCNITVQKSDATSFDKSHICTAIMHLNELNSDLLTSDEAAQFLRLSKATLWDKCRSENPIPHIRYNSRLFRFRKSDLERWLKERSK